MNDQPFVYVIYIRATPEAVWAALTDGVSTAKFWFGRTHKSTWTKGAPVTFLKPSGGVDFIGEVIESDPPKRLVFTFDTPVEDYGDRPYEGASRVTYEIAPVDGVSRLTLTHDRFPLESWIRRGVSAGWPAILSSLKTYLESGEALPARLDLDHIGNIQ